MQSHAITRAMQPPQASIERAPSPPRTKPATLPSLAIQSFASFQSQTSLTPVPIAVQASPIRRKPLPLESPVIGRFAQYNTPSSNVQENKDFTLPIQGLRLRDVSLPAPLTEDELFVPRNLDA